MNLSPHSPLEAFAYDPLDRIVSASNRQLVGTSRFYQAGELNCEVGCTTALRYLRAPGGVMALRNKNKLWLLASDAQRSIALSGERLTLHIHSYTPYGFDKMPCLIGYCGQRKESPSGLYLLGNGYRAYNPAMMRFGSPDGFSPFGAGGINAYAYCRGDPVNRKDPTGRFDWIHGITLGFVAVSILSTLLSRGTAAPAFAALGNILRGAPVAAGSVTAASVVAAVSVTMGTFAGLTQVAAITLAATANGDPSQVQLSRLVGLAGGTLGLMSTVSGLLAGKLAILSEQRVGKELASLLIQSLAGTPRTSLYPWPGSAAGASQSISSSVRTILGRGPLASLETLWETPKTSRVTWAANRRATARRRTTSEPPQATTESVRRRDRSWTSTDWETLYDQTVAEFP